MAARTVPSSPVTLSWEKNASKHDPEINWDGRAVAREITSGVAVEERQERLQHFLESKKVASLHVGEHRTGTLRQVEARTLTEYLARAITESRERREFRHTVRAAAREQHGRLIKDFENASDYHDAVRELASEAKNREPKFTDKEKINLEVMRSVRMMKRKEKDMWRWPGEMPMRRTAKSLRLGAAN